MTGADVAEKDAEKESRRERRERALELMADAGLPRDVAEVLLHRLLYLYRRSGRP